MARGDAPVASTARADSVGAGEGDLRRLSGRRWLWRAAVELRPARSSCSPAGRTRPSGFCVRATSSSESCKTTRLAVDRPRAALAEALYAQGRYDEAEDFARVCEELSHADDVAGALAHPRRCVGRSQRDGASSTEGERLRASGCRAPGRDRQSELAGRRPPGARRGAPARGSAAERRSRRLEEAIDLYERKGNVVSAGKARSLLRGADCGVICPACGHDEPRGRALLRRVRRPARRARAGAAQAGDDPVLRRRRLDQARASRPTPRPSAS